MRLSDEQIVQMLIEYVTDSRYKQAILIDGEWGSGKTFFVEEKLMSKLKDRLTGRSVFYISLYGVNDFDQIMSELYAVALEDFFDKKFGEGNGEKIGKGLNFASKIFSTGLKHFNVDSKDLPSLSDIKQIKDAVIIFDDMERCNINVNQLLGFINNLVEHNNIKVILVANQVEMGKIGISKDLSQKYLIALDSRIILDEVKDGKEDSLDKDKKYIDKEQLISRTDKLFSEDILYKKIKEKLIGLTIYYQADFRNIYEAVVEEYVKDEKAKIQLKISKQVVLDIFEKKQHYNIRTLIFGIMAYERFFEIIDTIDFDSPRYLQEHKERILKYTMELAIRIKSGKPTYSWNNSNAQTGLIYWGKSVFGEGVFGYKFVDTYLLHRYLNHDEIKNIITLIMVEKKQSDDYYSAKNSLVYNKLCCWWNLEDEEIIELLSKMKNELVDQKYSPGYFKDIVIMLMQMKYNNLPWIEYEDYIPLMKSSLENHKDIFKRQHLEILSEDPYFLNQYNTLIQPLLDVVDRKEKESKKTLNYYLDNSEPWDDNFVSKCEKNRSNYIQDKKFFFYMGPDNVIEKLKTSSVKEIYYFIEGIRAVYNSYNLYDFFAADAPNIHSLLDKMGSEDLSQSKYTRKIVLDKLEKILNESLEHIEK